MVKHTHYSDGKPLTSVPRDPDWIDWSKPSDEDLAKHHQRVGPKALPEKSSLEASIRRTAAAERAIILAKLRG